MRYQFGDYQLDTRRWELHRASQPIPVRPKVLQVLAYLLEHHERVVSKAELLEHLWPHQVIGDASLLACIQEVRRAIGDNGRTPRLLRTVRGFGYRVIVAVVAQEDGPVAASQPPTALPAPEGTAAPPRPASPPAETPAAAPTSVAVSRVDGESKQVTVRAALEGERKQVTVLFADIKDSLALISDRDPEAVQQLLDPALHAMMDAVHRYGGTVNQVLGDGIIALFGAPVAHEDHALRACYAALAMQAALRAYAEDVRHTHGLTLQSRIGLNAGAVVVRAIRNDLHMDYSAVGQTTHLAARLEQLAPPDTILLTAATVRLIEGLVRVKVLGPTPVKGLAEPVELCELLGASGMRWRLQTARARGLTHFVGRQTELDALHTALAQAGAGHGQVVAVMGEAGVGKSRLVDEFVWTAHAQGWLVLDCAAMSYGQATPYFPVLDLLRRYCHLEERDDTRTIAAKVTEQVLTLDATLQDTVPALLALFDALPEDSPFLTLHPSQRRQRTLAALKWLLLRASQGQPLLLVCEDLHWMDTETQALLDSLAESLPAARLLLLVDYRPGYQHGWGSKTYYTQLRLDPLTPASADALLQALLGDDPSLAPLTRLLIERTGGNPFFLEESVRALVETEVLVGERGAYRLATALPTVQVPAMVQAVLTARIDRLPLEDKRLLQTAAVIGMEVPLALLQAMAELSDEALWVGLAHLQAAEFLYETRLFPDLAYTFKHALTHEVAYGSLLQARRRTLHAGIVTALERLAPERLAEQVDRLAHHAFRGEVWDKALAYLRQAGEKAMARSAHYAAVEYFEQALTAIPHLPETHETCEQAIDLRLALRPALYPLGNSERILALLREAEPLAEALDDPRRLGRVLRFLSVHFHERGTHAQGLVAAQRALALAIASGDDVMQAAANHYLGIAYQYQGDYRRAIDCQRQSMAFWDAAVQGGEYFGQGRPVRVRDLFVPGIAQRAFAAMGHAELGTFAEGHALGDEGLQKAEVAAHAGSLWVASYGLGRLFLSQGDLSRALPLLERAVGICQDANLPAYFPVTTAALGAAYTLGGRVADAVALLTQAIEQLIATEQVNAQTLCRLALIEAQVLARRLDEAHTLAAWTLAHACERQERGNEAYALRLLGDIAARCEPPEVEQAAAHYQQALALADELGMRPLQAHCHCGLGMLYVATGQQAQARTELATAIAMYQSMEMTFWLPQAEAALAQVEGA
jgi:class 3 adenylate cyclase/DNA-binding winged helix-turn-helix (wHTH) protein/tetratricopeptide (TPR) repeat protein